MGRLQERGSNGAAGPSGPGPALRLWERFEPEGPRYVRILTRDGVPVGASLIGESGDASLLGQLRPFVRLRRPLSDPERFAAGGGAPGRFAWEHARCAS